MVKQEVDLDTVYDCGLNDESIESLIYSDFKIKKVVICGNTFFIKTTEAANKQEFIGRIIEKFGAIEVYKIGEYIAVHFFVFLSGQEIKQNINKKKYYYKKDIAKVYVNEEYYLRDIGNDVDSR